MMTNRIRRSLFGAFVVFALVPCAARADEKKNSSKTDRGASKPLAVAEHEVAGVDVALLEVKRGTGNVITVKWEYRNKTGQKKQLTDQSTGWIDPYRLASDAYLLDSANRVKYPVAQDPERRPIAGRHGGVNSWISIGPHQTLATWAKFLDVPEKLDKITVVIARVAPFDDVPISK